SRDGPGAVNAIRSNPASFLSVAEMAARAEAATKQRQAEWADAGRALRADPSLLVYYTFQDDPRTSRTLRATAGAKAKAHNGAVVGCAWVTGRWPGRDGLEFKRVSDRVRLTVPGEFESMTLAAWVRPDALPNQNNALMMVDGWKPGGVHWQIGIDGTVIFA